MCSVKTIFAIVSEEHVHFSASIGGINAIEGKHFTSAEALKNYLCGKLSILQDDIEVVQLKELGF
ncbi:MAG: hypothetical protein PUG10_01730 [Lachnospiraceae bacterium]|nr:hypothetical protein [Lachnospiraceae bacterium]